MAVTITEYDQFKNMALNGLDWDTSVLKIALFTGSHVPDLANTALAELLNECVGTGYVAGGEEVPNRSIASGIVSCDQATWAALTVNVRHVVLYVEGVLGGITNPVLLDYDLGSELALVDVPWSFGWVNSQLYQLTAA